MRVCSDKPQQAAYIGPSDWAIAIDNYLSITSTILIKYCALDMQ